MTDELLIEMVRNYTVLYNVKRPNYKDQTMRNAAWEEIAEELKMPVEKCKESWTKLRNAFASALKRRRNKTSGQAAEHIAPWRFEKQMSFLLPHMEFRSKVKNIKSPTPTKSLESFPLRSHRTQSESFDIDRFFNESSSSTQVSNPRWCKLDGPPQDHYNLMKTSNDLRETLEADFDETDYFLLSMSESLKRLPKLDQTKIKLDLHKAIYDAEVRQVHEKEHTHQTPTQAVTSCRPAVTP